MNDPWSIGGLVLLGVLVIALVMVRRNDPRDHDDWLDKLMGSFSSAGDPSERVRPSHIDVDSQTLADRPNRADGQATSRDDEPDSVQVPDEPQTRESVEEPEEMVAGVSETSSSVEVDESAIDESGEEADDPSEPKQDEEVSEADEAPDADESSEVEEDSEVEEASDEEASDEAPDEDESSEVEEASGEEEISEADEAPGEDESSEVEEDSEVEDASEDDPDDASEKNEKQTADAEQEEDETASEERVSEDATVEAEEPKSTMLGTGMTPDELAEAAGSSGDDNSSEESDAPLEEDKTVEARDVEASLNEFDLDPERATGDEESFGEDATVEANDVKSSIRQMGLETDELADDSSPSETPQFVKDGAEVQGFETVSADAPGAGESSVPMPDVGETESDLFADSGALFEPSESDESNGEREMNESDDRTEDADDPDRSDDRDSGAEEWPEEEGATVEVDDVKSTMLGMGLQEDESEADENSEAEEQEEAALADEETSQSVEAWSRDDEEGESEEESESDTKQAGFGVVKPPGKSSKKSPEPDETSAPNESSPLGFDGVRSGPDASGTDDLSDESSDTDSPD